MTVAEELVRFDSDSERLVGMVNSQARTPIALSQGDNMKQAFTTLWKAASDGDLDHARLLLRRGTSINLMTEKNKHTPLILAVQKNRVLMVKFLLEQKADVGILDADGKNAVQYAQEFDPRICVLKELITAEKAKNKDFQAKLTPLTPKRISKMIEKLHISNGDFSRKVMEETAKNQKILRALMAVESRPGTGQVGGSSRITDLQAAAKK